MAETKQSLTGKRCCIACLWRTTGRTYRTPRCKFESA